MYDDFHEGDNTIKYNIDIILFMYDGFHEGDNTIQYRYYSFSFSLLIHFFEGFNSYILRLQSLGFILLF